MNQEVTDEEKALHIHERLAEYAISDTRMLSEQTNMLLLANSFLFVGFVAAVAEKLYPLDCCVAGVGILMCALYIPSAKALGNSLLFFLNRLIIIEKSGIFSSWTEKDLTPTSPWAKYLGGETVKDVKVLPKSKAWLYKKFRPTLTFRLYIPILLILLWALLLSVTFCFSLHTPEQAVTVTSI